MPLTDLYWSVDEAGSWGGGGGGRMPASAESIGYGLGGGVLATIPAAAGFGVIEVTTTAGGAPVNFTITSVELDLNGWGVYGTATPGVYQGGSDVSPNDIDAAVIRDILTGTSAPAGNGLYVALWGALAQDHFTSITVNGVTYTSASATFSAGATSTWTWGGANPFEATGAIAGSYIV